MVNAEKMASLSDIIRCIHSEQEEQGAACQEGEGGEGMTCTFSKVHWLSKQAEQLESGLGGRFFLAKKRVGREVSDYSLQLGTYIKTKNQRFYRKKDANKIDLSIEEWGRLLKLAPAMTDSFLSAMNQETQRWGEKN